MGWDQLGPTSQNLSGACNVQESGAGWFCANHSAAFVGMIPQYQTPWKLLSSLKGLLHLLPPTVAVGTCSAVQAVQLEVGRQFCMSVYMEAVRMASDHSRHLVLVAAVVVCAVLLSLAVTVNQVLLNHVQGVYFYEGTLG